MTTYKCIDIETGKMSDMLRDLDMVEAKLRKMWDSGEIDTRVGYIYTLKNGKKYQWMKMNGKLINKDLNNVLWS